MDMAAYPRSAAETLSELAVEAPDGNPVKGVVRKLKEGYGFIAGNDGKDYFLHWTAMVKGTKNFRELEIGDRVSFLALTTERGPRAIEVKVTG